MQFLLVLQPGQPPPQSRSVSLPFFFPSLQVGAAQVPQATPPGHVWFSGQKPLAQSLALVQPTPVAQSSAWPPAMPKRPPMKVESVTVVVMATLPTPLAALLESWKLLPAQLGAIQPLPLPVIDNPEPLIAWQIRHAMTLAVALFRMSMAAWPAP